MNRVGAFASVFLLGAAFGGGLFGPDALPSVTYTRSVGVAVAWTGDGRLERVPDWDLVGPVIVVVVVAVLVAVAALRYLRRDPAGPDEPGGSGGNGSAPPDRPVLGPLRRGRWFSRKPGSP
jgi:hypothetical protein